MLTKIISPSAYLVATPSPDLPVLPERHDTQSATTAAPYVLTRLYEGKRSFLPQDQDTLSKIFKPLVRVPIEPPALQLSQLQKVGAPANAKGLGIFLDATTGRRYYVKKAADIDNARNEVLFGALARRFGVNVPETQVLQDAAGVYVASAWVEGIVMASDMFPGCAIDAQVLATLPRACPEIREAFVAAALLNNCDILGMALDNIGFTRKGDGTLQPVFLDFGGSGEYRATRGKKPFGPQAREFDSMTEPQLQAGSAGGGPNGMVFGNTPRPVLQRSLDRICAVSDGDLKAMIERHVPDTRQADFLFETLTQRRESIRARLEANTPDRFAEQVAAVVEYGLGNAYGWDDADPQVSLEARRILAPALARYLDENLHLMASSTGMLEISNWVEAAAEPILDGLLVARNGRRQTEAEYRARQH